MPEIFLTHDAAELIERRAVEQALDPETRGFRLGVALPRGIVLVADSPRYDDTVIRYGNRPLLLLSEEVAQTLDDAVIDVDEEGELVIHQGKATCEGRGCFDMTLDQWARDRAIRGRP